MGVMHGRDLYSSKYITAEIADSSNRLHLVPIKHTLGDYFLTEINNEMYAFKIEGSRILDYRESLVKTYRVIRYDTTHYLPLSPEINGIEIMIEKNGLPKINMRLFDILHLFGQREKESKDGKFTPHKLKDLIKDISDFDTKKSKFAKAIPKEDDKHSKEIKNIITFLHHLKIDEIVTPVKKLTEFLYDDLLATDPKYGGVVVTQHQITDLEHKKVTNSPITAKHAWMKMMLIIMGVVMVGAVIYLIYDAGYFDSIQGMFPDPNDFNFGSFQDAAMGGSPAASTDEALFAKYPEPSALRAAVDSGEVDYDSLSPAVKSFVDSVPSPKSSP